MIAIEAIARIKKRHCSKNNQCTDNCMHGDEYCEYALAIEALEKQTKENNAAMQRVIDFIMEE